MKSFVAATGVQIYSLSLLVSPLVALLLLDSKATSHITLGQLQIVRLVIFLVACCVHASNIVEHNSMAASFLTNHYSLKEMGLMMLLVAYVQQWNWHWHYI